MNEFLTAYKAIIIIIAVIVIIVRIAWFFALFKIKDKVQEIEEQQREIQEQNKASQKLLKDMLEMQRVTNELLGVMIRDQRENNPNRNPDE